MPPLDANRGSRRSRRSTGYGNDPRRISMDAVALRARCGRDCHEPSSGSMRRATVILRRRRPAASRTGLGSPRPRPVLAPLGLCTRIRRDKVSTFDVVWALSPISGCPSVVMPFGHDSHGLPFGVLLMARRWEDERQLMIAKRVTSLMAGFRRPPVEMR